jgi:hypothetical protein
MIHRLFLVIGLGLLAIGPILADVINITVNGSVSGSGGVTTYCLENLGSPECSEFGSNQMESFPFAFSATNIQLGVFVASGGASSPGPPENAIASVQANGSENTTATADALEITLAQDVNSDGVAIDPTVALNDSIAVTFNLTEESKIQLTDNLGGDASSNSVELLDSDDNVILVVQCADFSCSTVSTLLAPGTYQLDDSLVTDAFGGLAGLNDSFSADLNASFTPVVPEPRWTIIATLLAALLGGYVMSRLRPSSAGEVD